MATKSLMHFFDKAILYGELMCFQERYNSLKETLFHYVIVCIRLELLNGNFRQPKSLEELIQKLFIYLKPHDGGFNEIKKKLRVEQFLLELQTALKDLKEKNKRFINDDDDEDDDEVVSYQQYLTSA